MSRAKKRWPALVVAAAAVAVIGIVGASMLRDRAADEYWMPVAAEERTLLRSPQGPGSEPLEDVLRAYVDRDAEQAIEQLQNHPLPPEDKTATDLRAMFLASAQLNADRPQDALNTLGAIDVQWVPPPWRQRAQWVQYLALMELGRLQEAQDLLESLADAPGEIGERARKKLE